MNHKEQYWHDILGETLESVGKFGALTSDELEECAHSLALAAEMQGEAFGIYSIPDPSIAESKRMIDSFERQLKEAREEARIWKKEGCRVAKVSTSKAYINNGEVWVDRR